MGPIAALDEAALRQAFDGKFFAHVNAIQAALPHLRADGSVTIITAASARAAFAGTAGLAAANGALETMVAPLAVELAPLRVNAVSPGVIDTQWWNGMPADRRQAYFAAVAAVTPVRRVGQPRTSPAPSSTWPAPDSSPAPCWSAPAGRTSRRRRWPADRPGPAAGGMIARRREVGRDMATIGFIGSGNIGGTVARLAAAAGYQVVLSNSRGPQTLQDLVAEIGPLASAGTAEQAAEQGDIVVVAVPLRVLPGRAGRPARGQDGHRRQ